MRIRGESLEKCSPLPQLEGSRKNGHSPPTGGSWTALVDGIVYFGAGTATPTQCNASTGALVWKTSWETAALRG